jgi:hypothetical protein
VGREVSLIAILLFTTHDIQIEIRYAWLLIALLLFFLISRHYFFTTCFHSRSAKTALKCQSYIVRTVWIRCVIAISQRVNRNASSYKIEMTAEKLAATWLGRDLDRNISWMYREATRDVDQGQARVKWTPADLSTRKMEISPRGSDSSRGPTTRGWSESRRGRVARSPRRYRSASTAATSPLDPEPISIRPESRREDHRYEWAARVPRIIYAPGMPSFVGGHFFFFFCFCFVLFFFETASVAASVAASEKRLSAKLRPPRPPPAPRHSRHAFRPRLRHPL